MLQNSLQKVAQEPEIFRAHVNIQTVLPFVAGIEMSATLFPPARFQCGIMASRLQP